MCILVSPAHSVEPFLFKTKYDCFDKWQLIDTNYARPFLAVQHVRNIKKTIPYNCKIVSETGFKLSFHNKKFVTGKLLKCDLFFLFLPIKTYHKKISLLKNLNKKITVLTYSIF